jgi:hypothetical protein
MTHATFKSYLSTAKTAASAANMIYGYLWEANLERDGSSEYPLIVVEPLQLSNKIGTVTKDSYFTDCIIWIFKQWDRDSVTTREATWDAIDVIAKLFIGSINGSLTASVMNPSDIKTEPIADQMLNDWSVGCKYTVNLKIFC